MHELPCATHWSVKKALGSLEVDQGSFELGFEEQQDAGAEGGPLTEGRVEIPLRVYQRPASVTLELLVCSVAGEGVQPLQALLFPSAQFRSSSPPPPPPLAIAPLSRCSEDEWSLRLISRLPLGFLGLSLAISFCQL